MKIRVERDTLADAVAWVARSLPNRPTAPILAGLLMNASGDEVTLSSFDSTTSAQVTMPAEVTDEGTVLVSGRLLNEIARSLPNKPVEMVSDHTQVELVCESARFSHLVIGTFVPLTDITIIYPNTIGIDVFTPITIIINSDVCLFLFPFLCLYALVLIHREFHH